MQGKGAMDLTADQETRRRKSVDTKPASPFVSRLSARGDNPIFGTKMGRRQCKSAYNIIKNKTTLESSPPPTPKSDYCNADKAEENDLKKILMKMLEEAFEEKMKNVSKEIGENTNKKLEEINKEIEEKRSKKLEEMNNEIEEKKNKKIGRKE
ncbi:hypothetical protein STEG23_032367 [Scotinomys teguina]